MATLLQEAWPEDLPRQTFVGFRLNPDTGNLNIEIINDGSEVSIPDPEIIDKYAYKTWLWTRNAVNFNWGNKGHLRIEVI